jgi:dolichol-phosphate mannosyltransferase
MVQLKKSRADFVSIVVPTYKEAENLRALVTQISDCMSPLHRPYEIILVDDDSQDGSKQIVGQLRDEGYPVRIIIRVGVRSLSSAVIHGFREAQGNYLVCMDADLSHPPEAIPRLLESIDEDGDSDFAIGSRYVPGASTEETWGIFRWINSKVATLLARPFTRIKDPMSGFFALPRAIFEQAEELNPIGYKIGLELIVKCACRNIREIPIHFADRKYGQSKLNLKEQFNYLRHLKILADFKFGKYSRLIQFCLVGSTGIAVDLSLYSALLQLGLPLTMSRALAIWLAMNWNFWLNRRLTFSYSRRGGILSQYTKFVASCTTGAVISWSIAVLLPHQYPLFARHLLIAAIIGIIAGTLCNFLLSRYWVFTKLSQSTGIPKERH